jgi:nucleotide-binding universal stress UspA family protein
LEAIMSTFAPVLEPKTQGIAFRNILLATDFSDASGRALSAAAAFARRWGSQLLLVHAVPPEPRRPVPLDPLPPEFDRELCEAEKRIRQFLEAAGMNGLSCRTQIEHGSVWDVISSAIRDAEIDLLVMGTHGRGAIRKLALGSVAEEVLHMTDCPVLTVGPRVCPGDSDSSYLRTILFATDFGPASARALPYAVSLAENSDAQLVLVHMVPPMPLADAAYAPAVFAADDLLQWREAVRTESEKKLKELVPPGTLAKEPRCVVGMDFLPEGILCAAAEHRVDLIVMGANGSASPRIASHIPWALTHHVICDACCPVLTVRG